MSNIVRSMVLVCLLTGTLCAQVDRRTITRAVTDPTSAVIPSAAITLPSTDTALVLIAPANMSGRFGFSPIKIGTYSIKAKAKGFSTTQIAGLTLNRDQRLQTRSPKNSRGSREY